MDHFGGDRITQDAFFNGRLRISQTHGGYRFSIDAVILAGHITPRAGQSVLDLGTGCGIIPLILAYRHPAVHIVGVEVQATLAALAAENVTANAMAERIAILHQDMKTLTCDTFPTPFDWIISNPPYRMVSSGRINPDPQKAIARHELSVSLAEVVEVGRRLLKKGGKFAVVYPAGRTADVLVNMRLAAIEPKRMRMVHSNRQGEAKLVMVEGTKDGRSGLQALPPLVIYRPNGAYTPEMEAFFAP